MLDLISFNYIAAETEEKEHSLEQWIVFGLIIAVLVTVWVAALIHANGNKHHSPTRTADVIFAWFSPISYWILTGLGVIGPDHKKAAGGSHHHNHHHRK